ncbi:ABC transporter substrate-binding protein [Pararhodonellum marinum]|uniref:ABC transporter substrate-binding protein n=1 Tax=Pararhodonellum marinum TaxID=2755358 RepID=UPI00188F0513|nr:ABC transporter substrate-binding protein [Pararhodonellum marinum]
MPQNEFMFSFHSQYLLLVGMILLVGGCQNNPEKTTQDAIKTGFKTITDMRNLSVDIPINPKRILTVSDGMIETVMANFGVMDKLIAVGSSCLQRNFAYEIPGIQNSLHFSEGMNPIRLLFPFVAELPLVASSGLPLQLEKIAALQPDLILLREGCCTLPNLADPKSKQALSILSSFGIPVVVLKGTNQFDPPDLSKFNQEISLLGEIFDQEEKAAALIRFLDSTIHLVKNRTNRLTKNEQPSLLLLGLSPLAREGGSAGVTKGKDTMEGYMIEQLVNARNAYQGYGGRTSSLLLNTEQILALDPDVIVLPTASGYHPPEELYEAPYYAKLQNLKAVKARKVVALPWTPCNCSKRIEYPIDVMMMAKVSYPEVFKDIEIHDWVLEFYQRVYGVSEEKAKEIRSVMWLDWTLDGI